ncbi:PLP-dependent aminotransferase family protein [Vibrio sp. B1FLJ16]|uniref:aminotransferase-like domain-containing protein n=1 Tax=Vibrio sp. B1FLJ16 TaxID=2751178 RepID=UPI0015F6F1F5|nr:PLP-dependent aminotransferase family protein [Vibrio sp. B1FLJ16]CAD7807746.1 COG1167 Transcriptional regulators containing a DNA-binding HTH domain and an aminotransferase domain (MocR family) and their eukaryotic orthologs [Vibrio sp. B1FLJ16]CAE6906384.1 COG1167 Transcriptional regulators containing a DNA-binding HTH domain and an aminotransferase domain (MocR family) and their eukaryotic orthologs [Vibrio sp. B1FLJ16]
MNRYRQLAELFKSQIQQNTWRAGEKLPSVRATSRSHLVSSGTVLQAYQLLEAQGWVTAKPQSGYYVTAELERLEPTCATKNVGHSNINDELYTYLKQQGLPNAVRLGSAFPDPTLFPLEVLNRNLASSGRKMAPESLLDNLPPGSESLRRLIAQRYIQQGISTSHDDIVITSGALEALNLSLQAVTRAGDTVVMESPAFYGALQAIERLGLKVIEVPVDAQKGHGLEKLEAAFSNHNVRACWLMTNFQNPTGISLSDEQKKHVVRLADEHDVFIIEDDVYSELYFSENKPASLKSFDKQERVLHCASLSKSLCPGYRLGWVVNKRFNEQIQKLQLVSTLSGSAPIQQGIAHYLQNDSYDNHLRKLRKVMKQRQSRFIELLEQYFPKQVQYSIPEGGYFLWVKLPDGVDSKATYQALLSQQITVAYGNLFSTGADYSNYLRLNTSMSVDKDIESAIKKIGELLTAV